MKSMNFQSLIRYLSLISVLMITLANVSFASEAEEIARADLQYEIHSKLPKGWIDSLGDDFIIVDDLMYPVTRSLLVYDHKGIPLGFSSLAKGQFVALKKEDHLLAIYLLEDEAEPPRMPGFEPLPNEGVNRGSDFRFEDGVWKN
jgi:hypothetical protein